MEQNLGAGVGNVCSCGVRRPMKVCVCERYSAKAVARREQVMYTSQVLLGLFPGHASTDKNDVNE